MESDLAITELNDRRSALGSWKNAPAILRGLAICVVDLTELRWAKF